VTISLVSFGIFHAYISMDSKRRRRMQWRLCLIGVLASPTGYAPLACKEKKEKKKQKEDRSSHLTQLTRVLRVSDIFSDTVDHTKSRSDYPTDRQTTKKKISKRATQKIKKSRQQKTGTERARGGREVLRMWGGRCWSTKQESQGKSRQRNRHREKSVQTKARRLSIPAKKNKDKEGTKNTRPTHSTEAATPTKTNFQKNQRVRAQRVKTKR